MLTFIFSIIGWFLVTLLIFKKNIQNNVINVVLIISIGTLISCTLVNGIFGMKYPVHTFLYGQKNLYPIERTIYSDVEDSLIFDKFYRNDVASFISYSFEYDYLEARGYDFEDWDDIKIEFYDYRDTTKIPYMDILKETYNVPKDDLWINYSGIPKWNERYVLHIPNDSIHLAFVEYAKIYLEADTVSN